MHNIFLNNKPLNAFVANVQDYFGDLIVFVGKEQAFLIFYNGAV